MAIHAFDWLVQPIRSGGKLDVTVHVETGDHTAAIIVGTRIAGVVDAMRNPAAMADWPAADLVAYLDHVNRVRAAITYAEDIAILNARDNGASWADIAAVLNLGRTTLRERHARLVRDYNWPVKAVDNDGQIAGRVESD